MSLVDDIKALQANLIPDNTNNEISPKDVRDAEALPLDNWKQISEEETGDVFNFSTYAKMTADNGVVNVVYKVSNDPDGSKDGYYHWTGSAYQKDASLVLNVFDKKNTSDSFSGKAIFNHVNEARALQKGFDTYIPIEIIKQRYETIIELTRIIKFSPPTGSENLRWAMAIFTLGAGDGVGKVNQIDIQLHGFNDLNQLVDFKNYSFSYSVLPKYHVIREDYGDGAKLYAEFDLDKNESGTNALLFIGNSQFNLKLTDSNDPIWNVILNQANFDSVKTIERSFVSDLNLNNSEFTITAKAALNAIKGLEVFLRDEPEDILYIQLMCANNPPLGSAQRYRIQIYNETRSVFFNDIIGSGGVNKINFSGSFGTDQINGSILIDWDLLPDDFQLWQNGRIYLNVGLRSDILFLSQGESILSGKNLCWYGTSIPSGGIYGELACSALGANIKKESYGSTHVYTGGTFDVNLYSGNWIGALCQLSETIAEKQFIIDNYATIYPNLTNNGATPPPDPAFVAANSVIFISSPMGIADWIKSFSFEWRIINKYMKPSAAEYVGNADLIVWDHGFNDGLFDTTVELDYIKLLNTRDVGNPAYDAAFAVSRDRLNFISATNYIFDEIFKVNPYQRIVFISHFTEYNRGYLVDVQKELAKFWGIPIIDIASKIGFSDQIALGSQPLWNQTPWSTYSSGQDTSKDMTQFNVWIPDRIHPHTDPEYKAGKIISKIISSELSLIY